MEWWIEWIELFQSSPLAQGIIIALATFVLEDPVTIGSGLLVSSGDLSFMTAFLGLTFGIAAGDIGLYLIGAYLGTKAVTRGWLSEKKVEDARQWVSGWNLLRVVLVARFVPGTRLPTYVGAGVVKAPMLKFFMIALGASLIWSLLLLLITLRVGDEIGPLLGRYRWPIALGVLLLIFFGPSIFRLLLRLRKRRIKSKKNPEARSWEFLPPAIFYAPVAVYYVMLAIRYRSLTLPSSSNPSIYSGGIIGESKSQILNLLPEAIRKKWVPEFGLVKGDTAKQRIRRAHACVKRLRLNYPLVAKPDIGQRGDGVQLIKSTAELDLYAQQFPAKATTMLQRYCPHSHEAGFFYARFPGRKKGRIFSVTLKEFPFLKGDGVRTVAELIDQHPRFSYLSQVFRKRFRKRLGEIPADGTQIPLVFSGNHCQGAIFRNGITQLTPELTGRVDEICSQMPGFYFGRLDVRYEEPAELWAGKGFEIIEVNGASSEATHIWDPSGSLGQAYRDLFFQFRVAFHIGHLNRKNGARPVSIYQILRDWLSYQRISRRYPMTK